MTLVIFTGEAPYKVVDQDLNEAVRVTESAAKRARLSFNPSGAERVNRIKTLAAALYAELDAIIAQAHDETAKREAATAATHIQAGAMFAVSAATAHLS